MRKEEMRKIVNIELKTLIPSWLNEKQQRLWRLLFNALRQNDLSQKDSKRGEIIAHECIERLKQTNPEDFPTDQ